MEGHAGPDKAGIAVKEGLVPGPLARKQDLSEVFLPGAFIKGKKETGRGQKVTWRAHKAGSPHFDPEGILQDMGLPGKAQAVQVQRAQIVQHARAGELFYQGGQGMGRGGVILEDLSGTVVRGSPEEGLCPVLCHVGLVGGLGVAGPHGEHVGDGHVRQIRMGIRGKILRKEGCDPILRTDLSLRHQAAYGEGREGFGDREHAVEGRRGKGSEILLLQDLSLLPDKDAVHGKGKALTGKKGRTVHGSPFLNRKA